MLRDTFFNLELGAGLLISSKKYSLSGGAYALIRFRCHILACDPAGPSTAQ